MVLPVKLLIFLTNLDRKAATKKILYGHAHKGVYGFYVGYSTKPDANAPIGLVPTTPQSSPNAPPPL
jgi:hypothetical protein